MALTISGTIAKSHANNISRMIGSHLFTKEQLVGFFTWLDTLIKNSGTSDKKAASIRSIVGAAPYVPFTSRISARHPNYLNGYEHRKTRDLPDEVNEVFSILFSDDGTQPYGRDELLSFLDSMITLIGYDLENARGEVDYDEQDTKAEILTDELTPSIRYGVRTKINEMEMADPVRRASGVPV